MGQLCFRLVCLSACLMSNNAFSTLVTRVWRFLRTWLFSLPHTCVSLCVCLHLLFSSLSLCGNPPLRLRETICVICLSPPNTCVGMSSCPQLPLPGDLSDFTRKTPPLAFQLRWPWPRRASRVALPIASAGILRGLMGSRLSGAPSPPPRRCSRVLKVLFAQTQMELQPQRLVLSPRSFFSLSPYLQVPIPRSKETQTLYTHLLKLLLHGLLLRHPCFHDRLKGKRLWVDQKLRAFV